VALSRPQHATPQRLPSRITLPLLLLLLLLLWVALQGAAEAAHEPCARAQGLGSQRLHALLRQPA
jgi:hypothetical protein